MGGLIGTGGRRVAEAVVILALCLVTYLVFWQVVSFDFVFWDDGIEVYANPHIQKLDWAHLKWMFTDFTYDQRYEPLNWLSLAIAYKFCGLSPSGYHLINLVEHLIAVVLLFWVIRRILVCWRGACGKQVSPGLTRCAVLATLWWAIHPLRAEPVAWVTGHHWTHSCMFWLLALLLYLYSVDECRGRTLRRTLYWFSVTAYAIGLLFYPSAVGGAAVFIVMDFYPLRRFKDSRQNHWWNDKTRTVLLEKIPFLVVALACGLMTLWARAIPTTVWQPMPSVEEFTQWHRVMQAFYVCWYYVWIHWWPVRLSAVYTQLVSFQPADLVFVLSAIAVMGTTVGLVLLRKKYPGWLALWTCHLGILLPLLGLTQYPHYTSDRYAHIQGTIWAVAIGGIFYVCVDRFRNVILRISVWGLAGGIVVAFGFLAHYQTFMWQNTPALFSHMIIELGEHPYSADIYWRFGRYYLRRGQFAAAIECFDRTLVILGKHPEAFYVKGCEQHARDDMVLAANLLERTVDRRPDPASHFWLGVARVYQGRLSEATDHFERSILLAPLDAKGLARLGEVLLMQERTEEAIARLTDALNLDPGLNDARTLLNLALAKKTSAPSVNH